MMTNVSLAGLSREIQRFKADADKKIRLASYQTLTQLAEDSRDKLKSTFSKYFPDKDGIKKNAGVMNAITHPKSVDKSNPSNPQIKIYAKDSIDFMEEQEFGGERLPAPGAKTRATPFLETKREGRNDKGKITGKLSIKNIMKSINSGSRVKYKRGTHHKPKPFLMTAKSGHRMVAIRTGANRFPIVPIYHFDVKTRYRKRWGFFETIEGVVVSSTNRVFHEKLEKLIDK